MFRRLRNLIELSNYKPSYSDELLSNETLTLTRDIKPKFRPATIIEDDLPDMFEEQKDL